MRNEHFKFHKRHHSGEVENFYMILQQSYSGNGVPNFTRIARVLQKYNILQKHFGRFLWIHCMHTVCNVKI